MVGDILSNSHVDSLADSVLSIAGGFRLTRFTTLDVLGNTVRTTGNNGESVQARVVVLLADSRSSTALVAFVVLLGARVLARRELRVASGFILGREA